MHFSRSTAPILHSLLDFFRQFSPRKLLHNHGTAAAVYIMISFRCTAENGLFPSLMSIDLIGPFSAKQIGVPPPSLTCDHNFCPHKIKPPNRDMLAFRAFIHYYLYGCWAERKKNSENKHVHWRGGCSWWEGYCCCCCVFLIFNEKDERRMLKEDEVWWKKEERKKSTISIFGYDRWCVISLSSSSGIYAQYAQAQKMA